ncbi:uncharacterized protein Z518_08967 [Rhinocladiella mackenziei CBS 650.93]|uniref:Rhodopsin domain-containing protein n=1 Tax=Rhinocladiella mackenziei CBS 650.93 TaxID=1442369 RepID=A0A0D2FGU3_9EURO|nr:uncharacterized protein Z518_08967 [Rhinocladiella mackenziei CBS 650.93]KIX01242.1 hypothetical protein Z518_08967 [Rhinocladiella mackenziei CBS 650.93]
MVDTLHPPPSIIASWPKPNYVNPENRGSALVYISIILSILGIATVTARIYSRLFITRAPGLDDLLIVLALFFGVAMSVLIIIGNKVYFSGRHVWDIPIATFSPHRLNVWVSMWCYVTAASLVKISVLLFYRRLSVRFSKLFLVATWVGIVYNILYLIAFGLALLLICHPVQAYWKSFDPGWASTHKFNCQTEGVSLPASAGLSVLGDFYSTLLPMLLIFHLDLPRRQKLALYGLFVLGFLAVAAGIVRTFLLYRLLNVDYDFTWELWETWIWAVVELYVAIFAASAPALKPFLRRYFIETVGSLVHSRRRGDSRWSIGQGISDANWIPDESKMSTSVDVERIGVAYSDSESETRERSVLEDVGDSETRHFELRIGRNGKTIPMQVDKKSENSNEMPATPSLRGHERNRSVDGGRTSNWPMPPGNTYPGFHLRSKGTVISQESQHTIQVGLQLDRAVDNSSSRGSRGSVRNARLRAQAQMNRTRI